MVKEENNMGSKRVVTLIANLQLDNEKAFKNMIDKWI